MATSRKAAIVVYRLARALPMPSYTKDASPQASPPKSCHAGAMVISCPQCSVSRGYERRARRTRWWSLTTMLGLPFGLALLGCDGAESSPSPEATRGSSAANLASGAVGVGRAVGAAWKPADATSLSKGTPQPALRGGNHRGEQRATSITVVAGGDVSFGRDTGQRMLDDPQFEPLARMRPLLSKGDLSFVNLESPLAHAQGQTRHPNKPLVFCGPSRGGRSLSRAGIQLVSFSNNHVWDYGRPAFFETLQHLDEAGVHYVGASSRQGDAQKPRTLSIEGWSVAWLAVTDVWNAGQGARRQADGHVAFADVDEVCDAVKTARSQHDAVLVSYHGGKEYTQHVAKEPRAFARAVLQAGADAVIGHHPHVPQGVEWVRERPALYSLGNLRFERHGDHPWTSRGYLAQLTFADDEAPHLTLCPYRIDDDGPAPVTPDEPRGLSAEHYRRHFIRITSFAGFSEVGELDDRGCFSVAEAVTTR